MLVLSTTTLQHWREPCICSSVVPWKKEQFLLNDYSLSIDQKNGGVRESREPFQIRSEVFIPQRKAEVEVIQQQNHSFAPISPYK